MTDNEKVLKRLEYEKYSVDKIDSIIKDPQGKNLGSHGQMIDTYNTLEWIVNGMGLMLTQNGDVKTVDELVDMVLSSVDVMYEKVDISDINIYEFNEQLLAFTKDGNPVVIKNGFLCKHCYDVVNDKDCIMTSRISLQPAAYKIYLPIVASKFTFSTIVRYFLKVVPAGWVIKIFAITGIISTLGLVIPKASKKVLGEFVPMGSAGIRLIMGAAVFVFSVGILKSLLHRFKFNATESMKQKFGRTVETAVLAKILSMPVTFFRNGSTGQITQYVSKARLVGESLVDICFGVSVTALFSFVYIPQMLEFAPQLVAPAIILMLAELALNTVLAFMESELNEKILRNNADLDTITFDTVRGIQKIQEAGAQNRAYLKWADKYRLKMEYNYNPPKIIKLKKVITRWLPSVTSFVLLAIAAFSNTSGPDYIAFVSSYSGISTAVMALTMMINMFYKVNPAIKTISPLFESGDNDKIETRYINKIDGQIVFDHVEFNYTNKSGFKMNSFTYKIPKGAKIGIVGPSGCGKSTLVNMIMSINVPSSGTVFIDDYDLSTVNSSAFNRHIGFVAQYTQLLTGSLRYNIALGCQDVTDEQIWAALEKACIADYVRSLPQQLNTYVSEGFGGGFSGAQKQCLMLARAFVREPKIMVLDEATSAMDERTQAQIIKNIFDMDCTLVMVAHRIPAVKECDSILMVKDGNVVEIGTFDELIKANGSFAEFARISGI